MELRLAPDCTAPYLSKVKLFTEIKPVQFKYVRDCVNILTIILGVGLMAGAISESRNPEKTFQRVSSHLDCTSTSLDLDENGHQSSFSDFDLNSCSHGV